ncbi:MAG: Glucose/galactose transporter [Akkermansiaceae bacterium]|nr:Glucose/galactose transporter [Akkermansiaceae bacterium]
MTSSSAPAGNNRFAFSSVTLLFFMWGFITCMNDLLIPKFKADFQLSQMQANMVQFAFFGAYFVVSFIYFLISISSGDPINKIGYKKGLVLGLAVAGIGCLLFYPAAQGKSYPLFLGALVILGGGVTLIQIAANPFVSILGPEESAPSRLNLSQALNSLGYVIAPFIGGVLLFGKDVFNSAGGMNAVKVPYLGLGVAFIALAIIFSFLRLPDFKQPEAVRSGASAFRHRHFVWGWLAIFFYVGSEVTVGSILINYLADKGVMGLTEDQSAHFLSFYWGGVMIGRFMGAISLGDVAPSRKSLYMIISAVVGTLIIFGSATAKEHYTHGTFIDPMTILPYVGLVALSFVFFLLGRSSPGRMVGLFALVAAALTVFSMSTHGEFALWSIIGIGLFNSIMWSNIFTLSIRGLGAAKSQGSSLLVMMIVGGAVMPLIQGQLMDVYGVRYSLSVVLIGYAYLAYFGFFGSKNKQPLTEDEADKAMVAGH